MVNPGMTVQAYDLGQQLCAATYNRSRVEEVLSSPRRAAGAKIGPSTRHMGKTLLVGMSQALAFKYQYPIITNGRGPGLGCATPSGTQIMKQPRITASDFVDTPAGRLPVLPSKQRVREMLGHLLSFVEPSFFPDSEESSNATERRVRESLRCVGAADLDRLMREQREIR